MYGNVKSDKCFPPIALMNIDIRSEMDLYAFAEYIMI